MLQRLFDTEDAFGPTLARVALGVVMFPHGAQHLLGWFGGYGFAGTLGWMTGTLGIPAPLAALAIVTEFVAPILLVFGLVGRVAALGIVGVMLGALLTHVESGFFMNWFGTLPPGQEGFEFHIIAAGMAGSLALSGSGAWSLDRLIRAKTPRREITGGDPVNLPQRELVRAA